MELTKLSDKGDDEILELLENPHEPNPYLTAANKQRLERSLQNVKDGNVFERSLIEDYD